MASYTDGTAAAGFSCQKLGNLTFVLSDGILRRTKRAEMRTLCAKARRAAGFDFASSSKAPLPGSWRRLSENIQSSIWSI